VGVRQPRRGRVPLPCVAREPVEQEHRWARTAVVGAPEAHPGAFPLVPPNVHP
jgi:hypothetical protein